MGKILVLALCLLSLGLAGCASSEPAEEPESAAAPDRDGFSGQMGVYPGDVSDHGS